KRHADFHLARRIVLRPRIRGRQDRGKRERGGDQRAHDGLTPVTNTEKHTRLLIPHSRSCAGLTRASIFFARSFFANRWIAGSSPAMTTFALLRSFNNDLGRLDHRTPGFETLADQ